MKPFIVSTTIRNGYLTAFAFGKGGVPGKWDFSEILDLPGNFCVL
jgi:hypothetical protein